MGSGTRRLVCGRGATTLGGYECKEDNVKEIMEILDEAARLLDETETTDTFKTMTRPVASRIHLAHGAITLATIKLSRLQEEEDRSCS